MLTAPAPAETLTAVVTTNPSQSPRAAPLDAGETHNGVATKAGSRAKARRLTGEGRLLIVEDEAVIRFVLRTEFERAGFTVTEAGCAAEAQVAVHESGPPWIGAFVDYLLPDLTGDEVIAQLRRVQPQLPAVLMSGQVDEAMERLARERGFEILHKPFSLERVRPVLAQMVGVHRSGERLP